MGVEAVESVRNYHPLLTSIAEVDAYTAVTTVGATEAGRTLDLAEQPAGVLILASGHAVVEYAGRRRAVDRPEVFSFAGHAGAAPNLEPGVERFRVGRCDWLVAGGHPPLHEVPDARVFCTSQCHWIFVPTAQIAAAAIEGGDPLRRALRDRVRLRSQSFLVKLTRFAPLAHLSYDAVRHLASFFEVKRYVPGEKVLAAGEVGRPMLVLAGVLTSGPATFPPDAVLFEDALRPGPFGGPPPVLPDPLVARSRSTVAELEPSVLADLLPFDERLRARHDHRWARPWNAVVGDPDDDAPDAQTIALNLACREGRDGGPLAPAARILVIDADGDALHARATDEVRAEIPLLGAWDHAWAPTLPFGPDYRVSVVGLKPNAFTHPGAVGKLVLDVDEWVAHAELVDKVVFRVPRAGDQWRAVIERSVAVDVITDDLLDPLPKLADGLLDVVRIARPRPDAPFRTAARVPFVTLPRTPAPTAAFWSTGKPWGAS